MTRVAVGMSSALAIVLLVTGCDWYGQDAALRPLPYPYDAGVAVDGDGDAGCLEERGIRFVYGGEQVRTAGQDAACSLVDRGRQLWEFLAFLYSEREWRAGSFFANRLFEPRVSESGTTAFEYKRYAGTAVNTPDAMPQDVVIQAAEVLVYELRVKRGVMIVSRTAAGNTAAFDSVVAYLKLEHERGTVYCVERDRLLAYAFVHRYLDWSAARSDDGIDIHVRCVDDGLAEPWTPTLKELEGITFYTPDPRRTRVFVAGEMLEEVTVNLPDWTRRGSVTIRPVSAEPGPARPTPSGTST